MDYGSQYQRYSLECRQISSHPAADQRGHGARYESLAFYAFFPLKTPAAIIARLNAKARKYLDLPDTKERFLNPGVELVGSTPQEFAAAVRADTERMQKVMRATGLRAK